MKSLHGAEFLPFGTQVRIKNTASNLDGVECYVHGIAMDCPNFPFYILRQNDLFENGYDSIVLTSACIEVIPD
jgi:hypothetical protein